MESICHLPVQSERIETGPIQFGDDWPGVFIRGDEALDYAMLLHEIIKSERLSLWHQGRLGTLRHLLQNIVRQKSVPVCQECGTQLDDSDDVHYCGRCLEKHRFER
jgi:hypothetical protein